VTPEYSMSATASGDDGIGAYPRKAAPGRAVACHRAGAPLLARQKTPGIVNAKLRFAP